ncbi:Coiled-coil domain-containing protein 22, partial [Eschrichtius robustus]|nr:Coiled-coil domain-containing protein 22 [Eschrichtius robustus]
MGRAVPPDVQTLRAFTTELVVEAVVRCLRVINPAVGSGLSPLLPLAMSARFRLAMSLAQACMHPHRESDSAILLRAIGSQIRDQLALPWVPPLLRTPKLQHLQGSAHQKPFHASRLFMPDLLSRGEPREFQASPLLLPAPAQVPQPAARVASLLERHAIQLCQHTGRDRPRDEDWVHRASRLPVQMSELETLPRDVSRLAYTQRILEIVGNIRKQKEEITKILSDTKELQKEINSLSGKLDRTFAVTDELVFK